MGRLAALAALAAALLRDAAGSAVVAADANVPAGFRRREPEAWRGLCPAEDLTC